MRIRIDAEEAAQFQPGAMPAPIQVEAPGFALISTATPFFAQAARTFSISISYPGRRNNWRPVICPRIVV